MRESELREMKAVIGEEIGMGITPDIVYQDIWRGIHDLAWLITHYEIVYDPGVATEEERKRAEGIFKRACVISPPEAPKEAKDHE